MYYLQNITNITPIKPWGELYKRAVNDFKNQNQERSEQISVFWT